MKSFSEFLRINEAEIGSDIFNGLKGDPYQYKIETNKEDPYGGFGVKTYYAKKSLGTLDANSDKWIEQTSDSGKPAIIALFGKIPSDKIKRSTGDKIDNVVKETTLDEKTKAKIIELQEILNKAKPAIPKLWTLPLSVDGNPGWRTAWSWYMIMIIYPQMDNINDISFYSKESFQGFKTPSNWGEQEINSGLDFFQKFIIPDGQKKEK